MKKSMLSTKQSYLMCAVGIVVLFGIHYREDYYIPDTEDKNIAEIIIAKQRNGPVGTVRLAWMPQYTRFGNELRQDQQ